MGRDRTGCTQYIAAIRFARSQCFRDPRNELLFCVIQYGDRIDIPLDKQPIADSRPGIGEFHIAQRWWIERINAVCVSPQQQFQSIVQLAAGVSIDRRIGVRFMYCVDYFSLEGHDKSPVHLL